MAKRTKADYKVSEISNKAFVYGERLTKKEVGILQKVSILDPRLSFEEFDNMYYDGDKKGYMLLDNNGKLPTEGRSFLNVISREDIDIAKLKPSQAKFL